MTIRGKLRFGVFVWDADGDMGQGVLLGPMLGAEAAEGKAESVRREAARRQERDGSNVQAMVVNVLPGSVAVKAAVKAVI